MKNVILKFGKLIIGTLVIVGYLMTVFMGVSAMAFSITGGLIIIVEGFLGVTISAFVIYLLIDISENLRELNAKKNYEPT